MRAKIVSQVLRQVQGRILHELWGQTTSAEIHFVRPGVLYRIRKRVSVHVRGRIKVRIENGLRPWLRGRRFDAV